MTFTRESLRDAIEPSRIDVGQHHGPARAHPSGDGLTHAPHTDNHGYLSVQRDLPHSSARHQAATFDISGEVLPIAGRATT
jgi:hypothetical protein